MRRENRILIIGDAMIDTYIYGSVKRISPEAPVPIVCSSKEAHCLGGAANVARNAASLGAIVTALFIVGNDMESRILESQLDSYGVNCDALVKDETQRTINKMRVVGNNQQIARVDFHDAYIVSDKLAGTIISKFREHVDENDIVIISDYNKGTCTDRICREIIRISKEKGKIVIVDPKGNNWEKYRGASVITPNMKEINSYSGKKVENDSAKIETEYGHLNKEIGVDYLLITRSECGMSLIDGEISMHIPTQAQEVYDVSGAGDTVVAALAATLHAKMDNIVEAVRWANIAAGVVVAKPGTAVVTREEIQGRMPQLVEKKGVAPIYTLNDYEALMGIVKFWRTAGDQIVTTNGCFDIVHCGHVKLLDEAKKLGDRLIVAINSDASVKRLKGEKRPINKELDRAYVISSLKSVDAVVVFDPKMMPYEISEEEKQKLNTAAVQKASEAPMALMKLLKPDIHVKGGDYEKEDIPEALFSDKLALVNFMEGYSTTNIIEKVSDN